MAAIGQRSAGRVDNGFSLIHRSRLVLPVENLARSPPEDGRKLPYLALP